MCYDIFQEADIAAAPLFITPRRSRVVDFTRPYMTVQAAMVIKRPPAGQSIEVNIYKYYFILIM